MSKGFFLGKPFIVWVGFGVEGVKNERAVLIRLFVSPEGITKSLSTLSLSENKTMSIPNCG